MPFGLCWRGHTKRYVEGYILCEENGEAGTGSDYAAGQLVSGTFTGPADQAEGVMFDAKR